MLIEHLLIDVLGRKVMAYTLQDLQCAKCSDVCLIMYFLLSFLTNIQNDLFLQIKMENLNAYCSCAGSYMTVTPRNDMMSYLKTFKAIADYYDMSLLKQILQQYLN